MADPGDTKYDGMDYATAFRGAQEQRAFRAENELEFVVQEAFSVSSAHAAFMAEGNGFVSFNAPLRRTHARVEGPGWVLDTSGQGALPGGISFGGGGGSVSAASLSEFGVWLNSLSCVHAVF